jgi:hypothetical protein
MLLLKLTGCLSFLFAVAVGAVVLVARRQPAPEQFTQLHLGPCAPPCWNGIQPGVTTFDEAIDLLLHTFGQSHYARLNETHGELNVVLYPSEIDSSCFSIWLSKTETAAAIIHHLLWLFSPARGGSTFDLPAMLLLFGPPDYVVDDWGNASPQLPMIGYKTTTSTGIRIPFKSYPPSQRTLLDVLEFYSVDPGLDETAQVKSWQGIARFNR